MMVGMTQAGLVSQPLFVPDASHIPYYPFVKTLATVLLHFPELSGCAWRGAGLSPRPSEVKIRLPELSAGERGRATAIGMADMGWLVDWIFRFVKAMACG